MHLVGLLAFQGSRSSCFPSALDITATVARGDAHTRVPPQPLYLARSGHGVEHQFSMVFHEPYRGPHGGPVAAIGLEAEIPLAGELVELVVHLYASSLPRC